MGEEEIFMTHLPGTQLSLLTFLVRDIESVFNSIDLTWISSQLSSLG